MMTRKLPIASVLSIMTILTVRGVTPHRVTENDNVPYPQNDQVRAEPVVVWNAYDPWQRGIGSDSTSFALYNSGLVIFLNNDHYQSVTLNEAEYEGLVEELGIHDGYFALNDHYDLTTLTDQPTNLIHVWNGGEWKWVVVYGNLRVEDRIEMDQAPPALRQLIEAMINFEHPDAQEWLPSRIELMLSPSSQPDGVEWPTDFPSLNSEYGVRSGFSQVSVFLDATNLDHLVELREDSFIFIINGTSWYYSWAYPFPNAMMWYRQDSDPLPSFDVFRSDLQIFGADVFVGDEWTLTMSDDYAENNYMSVVATWQRDDPATIANYSRQATYIPWNTDDIAASMDDWWVAIEWMAYSGVQVVKTCALTETVLVDLMMVDEGKDVFARYWIWSDGIMLDEFKLVLSTENMLELEALANDLFPNMPRCPQD